MIRIREIDHVVLRVKDLDAMLRFYCGALGCPVEKEQKEIGLTQLRAGRSLIDFLVDSGGNSGNGLGNMDHFCVRIESFDAEELKQHLRSYGIDPGEVASRYGAEGDGPSLYIKDPEGNTVELKGPPWRKES